jgi:hypothetical protein
MGTNRSFQLDEDRKQQARQGERPVNIRRILIPARDWTKFDTAVFTDVFPKLRGRFSAAFYSVLYDRAWHSQPRGHFAASYADMVRWTGFDSRVVRNYVNGLLHHGFLRQEQPGIPNSRSNKPKWSVPLVVNPSGGWVPVPRFFCTEYIRRYPNSVLLIVLLSYQHLSWRDDCWVGPRTLSKRLNWSERRVYQSLHTMLYDWEKLDNGLPCPLETAEPQENTEWTNRHFSVRAFEYFNMRNRSRGVRLAPEFKDHFDI